MNHWQTSQSTTCLSIAQTQVDLARLLAVSAPYAAQQGLFKCNSVFIRRYHIGQHISANYYSVASRRSSVQTAHLFVCPSSRCIRNAWSQFPVAENQLEDSIDTIPSMVSSGVLCHPRVFDTFIRKYLL
jgi:hypothetical protein